MTKDLLLGIQKPSGELIVHLKVPVDFIPKVIMKFGSEIAQKKFKGEKSDEDPQDDHQDNTEEAKTSKKETKSDKKRKAANPKMVWSNMEWAEDDGDYMKSKKSKKKKKKDTSDESRTLESKTDEKSGDEENESDGEEVKNLMIV